MTHITPPYLCCDSVPADGSVILPEGGGGRRRRTTVACEVQSFLWHRKVSGSVSDLRQVSVSSLWMNPRWLKWPFAFSSAPHFFYFYFYFHESWSCLFPGGAAAEWLTLTWKCQTSLSRSTHTWNRGCFQFTCKYNRLSRARVFMTYGEKSSYFHWWWKWSFKKL